ncbi:histidine kinase [Streptomyces sp. NPDC048290]|uniref:sensor histidine kinase n=1 Tax=Streptomyces sp. NPDC048290 TaxID=3155811 RepID=UPI003444AFC3
MDRPTGWWRGKSTPAKVEVYTRWSFHLFVGMEILLFGLPLFAVPGPPAGAWALGIVVVHTVLCAVNSSRALDWVVGTGPRPVRLMWLLGVVTVLVAGGCLVLAQQADGEEVKATLGAVVGGVLIFGIGSLTIALRDRRQSVYLVVAFTGIVVVGSLAFGASVEAALVASVGTLLGGTFLAATSYFSVWLLNAVYELDAARENRTRLAVAEERLRFGRDLHDVMGRNLAVIALKSELAVQLTRRGRPEAVEQMIEVQRIAHESQREVRDVVRGYREAELGVELSGAQGVLTAAGIACEVRGEALAGGLPAEVQSALAWVVREATTNVLRHGDAARCGVSLRVREGFVALTVENDGVAARRRGSAGSGLLRKAGGEGAGPHPPGGGSGLAGLRERLTAVGGTLEAGPVGGDRFRLLAEVPLGTPVAADGVGEVVA